MPLLPQEPNHYPHDLFAPHGTPAGDGRAWWVIHTKPRQEKSLARQLRKARVPFYLPLARRRHLLRGRVLHAHLPLFPGYVFLLADREERGTSLATGRVANALSVPDQQGLWHDLRRIDRLLASGAPVTPEERLAPGARVTIREGPLAGLEGCIVREASGRRFVVRVDFIQRGASVLLDDFLLAALPEAPALAGK